MNGVLAWSEGMAVPMRPAMSVMETIESNPVSPHTAGLAVEVDVPSSATPGKLCTLTVTVRDAKTGDPVEDLVRTHQVWMHMIITRADLGAFAHIHPEPTGQPGRLRVQTSVPDRRPVPAAHRVSPPETDGRRVGPYRGHDR